MSKYLYINTKTGITRNQLWLRRYWFTKFSKMKKYWRYKDHRSNIKQHLFLDR